MEPQTTTVTLESAVVSHQFQFEATTHTRTHTLFAFIDGYTCTGAQLDPIAAHPAAVKYKFIFSAKNLVKY